MTIFTIDPENNTTAHRSSREARATGFERFSTAKELAELAAGWPMSRLIQIWNSLPGVTPVKRFTDRQSGVSRIWNAVQTLSESGDKHAPSEPAQLAAPEPHVAPTTPVPARKATQRKKARTSEPKAEGTGQRTKTDVVLALLAREGGATLKGIMEATGWQAHSVRGFVSGTLGKKMGITVESAKAESGERRYSIPA